MAYLNRFVALSLLLPAAMFGLNGCSGIAKGVTQAVMESGKEQVRYCDIVGEPLKGIDESLLSQKNNPGKVTKVLMVHGISRHVPGYSTQFRDNITNYLGMDRISRQYKEILIKHPDFVDEKGNPIPLGVLRVTRHTRSSDGSELLFYELTWSEISDGEKETLSFDTAQGFKRADANKIMKQFFNSTVSDLMVYRGTSHDKITKSVGQSVCWAFNDNWDSLPSSGQHFCDAQELDLAPFVKRDDYFFVTHSLGSRIVVDTLDGAIKLSGNLGATNDPEVHAVFDAIKNKEMTVLMMANQLPLLSLGEKKPKIINAESLYCGDDAVRSDERVIGRLNIVAFSDPNDVLSYSIPPEYAKNSIDSRLCPHVTNIDISVSDVNQAFGVSFANPVDAHGGYQSNGKVAAIVAGGIGPDKGDIPQDCNWVVATD